MKAMILAAGRGERMGALTAAQPKPLLEIGGRSLVEHHVVRLVASGVDEIVINLSYRGTQIRAQLGDFGIDAAGHVCAVPPLLTYAGIALFDPRSFAKLEPGRRPLKPWLDAAIARRELRGLAFAGSWLDVGTPERLEAARAMAAEG